MRRDRHPGNLAYSPELREWIFDFGLDLNFDLSHLPGMGIDPVAALRPDVDRVRHVQANDVEILPQRRNRVGYLGPVHRADAADGEQWRYRAVGLDDIDWRNLVDVLMKTDSTAWCRSSMRTRSGTGRRRRCRPASSSPTGHRAR